MYSVQAPAMLLPKPNPKLVSYLSEGDVIDTTSLLQEIRPYLDKLIDASFVHIDIETTGLSPYTKKDKITLIALAGFVKGRLTALSFPMPENTDDKEMIRHYLQAYLDKKSLIAFNATFDMSFLTAYDLIDPKGRECLCALTLFRMLMTERSSRSLGSLCAYAFQLDDTHKDKIDPLLKKHKLNKGDMSKLLDTEDRHLFMKYNLEDAISSCVLFDRWLVPWLKEQEFSDSMSKHWHQWARIIAILLEQEQNGIKINKERLDEFKLSLEEQVSKARLAFTNNAKVVKWLRIFSKKLIEKWYQGRSLSPSVVKAMHADEVTPDGKWLFKKSKSKTLNEWQKSLGGYYFKFTIPTPAPDKFTPNIDSDDHLVDFFYNYLYTEWTKEKDFRDKWVVNITLDDGRKEVLDCAEEGGLPVNKDYLHLFGKPGALLLEYRKLQTIQQFVTQLYEHMDENAVVHHRFNPHGTITGRLSASGGINFAQQPKNLEYMRCLSAPEGHKFVQMDFCLPPNTDLLTKNGWKSVLDITKEDEVWQVNKDSLQGSWTNPTDIVHMLYSGDMYSFGNRRGSLTVTANHKMLWSGQQTHVNITHRNKRTVNYSQDGIPNETSTILQASYSNSSSDHSAREIWLACMLQADGSRSNLSKYKDRWNIQVSLERKRNKVAELLGRNGTLREIRECHTLPVEHWSGIEFSSNLLNYETKTLSLSSLGTDKVEIFLDALSFWDGSIGNNKAIYYSTSLEENANQVQAYLVRSGYEAKIKRTKAKKEQHADSFSVIIRKHKGFRVVKSTDEHVSHYTGKVGCVTVPEGFILVRQNGQTFITGNCALEKIVQTQFSNDPLLRKLYASDEKHDVYLYNAKEFYPDIIIRSELQAKYKPDPDVLAAIKKEYKDERKVSKGASLSFDYGCGAYTSWKRGRAQGLNLTLQDWKFIHKTYWEMYSGVKDFESQLKIEAEEREGFILSGFGLPLVIEKSKEKDILNTFVQHTGHQVLLLLLDNIDKLRHERNMVEDMKPYIADLHDETIWLVREGREDVAKDIIEASLRMVNEELGHEVKFSGVVDIFDNMAEIKELE